MSKHPNATGKWLPNDKVKEAAIKAKKKISELRIEKSEAILTNLMEQKDTWLWKAPKTREDAIKMINSSSIMTFNYYDTKNHFANKEYLLCQQLICLCNAEPTRNIFVSAEDFISIIAYYGKE